MTFRLCRGIALLFVLTYTEPKNEVNAIDVSITGDYLVSCGKDAAVRLYNTQTAQVSIITIKYLFHQII